MGALCSNDIDGPTGGGTEFGISMGMNFKSADTPAAEYLQVLYEKNDRTKLTKFWKEFPGLNRACPSGLENMSCGNAETWASDMPEGEALAAFKMIKAYMDKQPVVKAKK